MILVHWSCQISDSSHIETETAICKISIMMLRDHAHPYIQSTTVLCDRDGKGVLASLIYI